MARFSYRREFSPVLGEILRPVAQVAFQSVRGHWFPASLYIDSGADMTLVPLDFGKLLGLDLAKNRTVLAGVTGAKMTVSLHSRRLRIGSSVLEGKIAVALRNNVPYLLGREGVFRAFKITFEEYKNLISFHRGPFRKKVPERTVIGREFRRIVEKNLGRDRELLEKLAKI